MTPAEMLDVIDAALAKPGGNRAVVLELRNPVVLGVRGRLLGHLPDETPVYGFTKRDCRRIQGVIYDAARHDLDGGTG